MLKLNMLKIRKKTNFNRVTTFYLTCFLFLIFQTSTSNPPLFNPDFEKATGARFCATVEEVLRDADVVSIHVPLLDSTKHLMNAERLAIMKNTAYLVNTSRGPVIDEVALVAALRAGVIAGAGIDVYEHEPALAPGLAQCANAVLTPHIASASVPTRDGMARLAAENLIAFFEGKTPPNAVQ